MVEEPIGSLQRVLVRLREGGYIEDESLMVERPMANSGLTDLRVPVTGHVAEGR